MSLSDPIADMFTRIRNAQAVRHPSVLVPASRFKRAILDILLEEGYINAVEMVPEYPRMFKVLLKYYAGQPVIDAIKRVSRPGLRIYSKYKDFPEILNGLGVSIVSTPGGVLTGRVAAERRLGGEILGYVA